MARITMWKNNFTKLLNLIRKRWVEIIGPILLGQFIGFWLVPHFLVREDIKIDLSLELSPAFFLLIVLPIFLLKVISKPVSDLWVRYVNNYNMPELPFTHLDSLMLLLMSTLPGIYFYFDELKAHISISRWGIVWLGTMAASLFIFSITVYIKGRGHRLKTGERDLLSETAHFTDEPITKETDDLLDRKRFVEDLSDQIINYPFPDSFVFAIYGKWGDGKTSVVNLLRNKLSAKVLVFDFDPWIFSTTDALIENFYKGLYQTLNRRFFLPDFRRLFTKYQNLLMSGLKAKGIDIDFLWPQESLEELRLRIENLIAQTGHKLVITIDDIDRLQDKNDILQVFKLVKLSGKFRNTIYILSFDHERVDSLFRTENRDDSSFLEKIVQAPLHLPAVEQASIDRYLYYSVSQDQLSRIDRLFKKLSIDHTRIKQFKEDFNTLYDCHISRLFTNLRHAKRFLNSLYQTFPAVKEEVHLQDFFVLEVIKVFHPLVYEDIQATPWFYIPSSWDLAMQLRAPFEMQADEKEKYKRINAHISKLVETQPKPNVLLELLKTIFFEVRNAFAPRTRTGHQGMESSYRKEKRLTHPDVFPKYFTLSVSPSDLPDQMIESLIYDLNSLEPAACSARFIPRAQDFQERKQLATLLRRLILFRERMTPRTTRSLIDNIYRNSNMFSKEGSRAFFNSEFDEALRLLLMLIDGLAPVEIDIVLRDIVQKTPSLELAVRVLDLTRRRTGQYFNIYESANVGELSRTLAERLNAEFVEKGRNIFSEEPSYAYVLHQWGKLSPDENRKINTYVFGLAERDPSILGKIIKTYTENWGEPLGIKLRRDDLADLYDEKRLYEMTKRSLDVSYSNDAEKTAVTEFIRQYEERQRTAAHEVKQQAARQSFITANSKGLQASGQRDFKTALEQYDLALQHIDWSDEHHWSDQVKLKRWETLLELALQKEGPIQREFFAEASRVASTEAQIRDLISAAYPGGTPDRAPCELYYCLFYYLLWNNPDASKRHEVKHNFETHYVIATGNSTSGRTDEIAQRCNELRERMEGGDKADKI